METTQEEIAFEELEELVNKILLSYIMRPPKQSEDEWLMKTFSENLPKESAARITEICAEVKENFELMNKFLAEARSSRNYELESQNWFYEKIKSSVNTGDFEMFKNFHRQNAILDNINKWSLEAGREFRGISLQTTKDDDEADLNNATESQKKSSTENSAVQNSSKVVAPASSIRKDAINSGIKKSIMTQYQRIMRADMAQINFRTSDVTNIAMSLSRNAALTGICGMMLTSGLSILKSRAIQRKVLSGAVKVGATDGVRMALTAALKVGAEKRIIPILTRATPMLVLTATSLIAVESAKVMARYSRGEIKCFEAFNQVSKISTSALCAVSFGIKGAVIGATAFATVPVAGPFVGAFIGELVGNSFGYSIGRKAHSKISSLLMNAKDLVAAHYGILEHLVKQTVTVKQKEKLRLWN